MFGESHARVRHTHTRTRAHTHNYILTHTCLVSLMHVCGMSIPTHIHIHTRYTHAHTRAHTHTLTHVCVGEEVVRGRPLFVLAPMLQALQPLMREAAGVSSWQVWFRGCVCVFVCVCVRLLAFHRGRCGFVGGGVCVFVCVCA